MSDRDHRDHTLLRKIEEAVLDDSIATTAILRQCIILGGQADSVKLRDWAHKELSGYDFDDALPSYRMLGAQLRVELTGSKNTRAVGSEELPDDVDLEMALNLRQGLGEIEAYVRASGEYVRFVHRDNEAILEYMHAQLGYERLMFNEIYWKVSRASVQGLVEQVRTSLAVLVGELISALPPDREVPTQQATDQAVSVVVTGKRNVFNVLSSQAAGGGTSAIAPAEPKPNESFFKGWRKRGIVVGIATVVSAVVGIAAWLGWTPWS